MKGEGTEGGRGWKEGWKRREGGREGRERRKGRVGSKGGKGRSCYRKASLLVSEGGDEGSQVVHGLVDGSSVHAGVKILAGPRDPELEVDDALAGKVRRDRRGGG
eukprot:764886-Hanusia_phi.AAC.2